MTITENMIESSASLELIVAGRLDTNTAPELEAKIKEHFAGVIEIIIDLAAVEYLSSAGLRVILLAYKMAGKEKRITIRNPSQFCMQIFEATGMSGLLNIVKK